MVTAALRCCCYCRSNHAGPHKGSFLILFQPPFAPYTPRWHASSLDAATCSACARARACACSMLDLHERELGFCHSRGLACSQLTSLLGPATARWSALIGQKGAVHRAPSSSLRPSNAKWWWLAMDVVASTTIGVRWAQSACKYSSERELSGACEVVLSSIKR